MTDDQEIAIAEVTALEAVTMARKTEPCLWCGEAHVYTGFIYRWVHCVSGKWYLGSHYGCLEDGYIGSGVIFKKALDKHGVEAFNREIIALTWCSRRKLLSIEEEILIAVDARGDQMSYNTKNKGLGQDPEVTRAIWLGRKRPPEETVRRLKSFMANGRLKGQGNGRAQAVVNLTTGDIYTWGGEAIAAVNGHAVGLSQACTDGCLHRDCYWMFLEEWESLGKPERHPRTDDGRDLWRVVRLTDGKIYMNAGEAAQENAITKAQISLAAAGSCRSAGGHFWMKEADWIEAGKPIRPYEEYQRSRGRVVNVETLEFYDSMQDCAEKVGMTFTSVMKHCQGKIRKRRFVMEVDWIANGCRIEGMPRPAQPTVASKYGTKRVMREDSMQEFNSAAEAARSINSNETALRKAISEGRPYKDVTFRYLEPAVAVVTPKLLEDKSFILAGKTYDYYREVDADYGLEGGTFRRRLLDYGWTPEQAVGLVPPPVHERETEKAVTVEGVEYPNLMAAVEAYPDLAYRGVLGRINRGWSVRQAFGLDSKPVRVGIKGAEHYRSKEFKVRNQTFPSMQAAAEHFELKYPTVHKRISKYGWTNEQAVGLEPQPNRRDKGQGDLFPGQEAAN